MAPGLEPRADQQQAIDALVQHLPGCVTLAGATGTGKTFVMANVIYKLQWPTLVLAHNKDLCRQLWSDFKSYLPEHSVELLTSAFDFYRPSMVGVRTTKARDRARDASKDLKPVLLASKSRRNAEGSARREEAIQSIRTGEMPIVVASSTAIFPMRHPDRGSKELLEVEEAQTIQAKVEAELLLEVQQLRELGSTERAQRLQETVEADMNLLLATGKCKDLYDKYGHLLPSLWSTTPVELFKQRYGEEWMLVMDESHVSLPHLRTPSAAVRARKERLVREGFYLSSSVNHRPLSLEQLLAVGAKSVLLASATPDEKYVSAPRVEMVQRPTHILDPEIEQVKSTPEQYVPVLCEEIKRERDKGNQVLVVWLRQYQTEVLAEELGKHGLRADFLHCARDNSDRAHVLQEFREGRLDVLVGVNLFREGLSFPRVSRVVVLDADAGGFLRTSSALIQVVGRAARHPDGKAIFVYKERVTAHMQSCIDETQERRKTQMAYNLKHGYKPERIYDGLCRSKAEDESSESEDEEADIAVAEYQEAVQGQPQEADLGEEVLRGMVPGIGQKIARRLLDSAGGRLENLASRSPLEIMRTKGVAEKRAQNIKAHIKDAVVETQKQKLEILFHSASAEMQEGELEGEIKDVEHDEEVEADEQEFEGEIEEGELALVDCVSD